jgi:hypothetical protein
MSPDTPDLIQSAVGPPRTPIRPIKDKTERKDLLERARDAQPVDKLRILLACRAKPPDDLISSTVITGALNGADCWKYRSQLVKMSRTIEASAILESLRLDLSLQSKPDLIRWIRTVRSVAALWEEGPNRPQPSAETVIQYLRLAIVFLQDRADPRVWLASKRDPRPRLLCELVRSCVEAALLQPGSEVFILGLRSLNLAITKQKASFSECDDVALISGADLLWQKAFETLEGAMAIAKLDIIREMLSQLVDSPYKSSETKNRLSTISSKLSTCYKAVAKLFTELYDTGEPLDSLVTEKPDNEVDAATIQWID